MATALLTKITPPVHGGVGGVVRSKYNPFGSITRTDGSVPSQIMASANRGIIDQFMTDIRTAHQIVKAERDAELKLCAKSKTDALQEIQTATSKALQSIQMAAKEAQSHIQDDFVTVVHAQSHVQNDAHVHK
jgi:hypothetical protein